MRNYSNYLPTGSNYLMSYVMDENNYAEVYWDGSDKQFKLRVTDNGITGQPIATQSGWFFPQACIKVAVRRSGGVFRLSVVNGGLFEHVAQGVLDSVVRPAVGLGTIRTGKSDGSTVVPCVLVDSNYRDYAMSDSDLDASASQPIMCEGAGACMVEHYDPEQGCWYTPLDCDDGLFCNGQEGCDAQSSQCVSGSAPVLDDGIDCTTDLCDEINDQIVHTPDDVFCDDGYPCNGIEVCDVQAGGCQTVNVEGSSPLIPGDNDCDGDVDDDDFAAYQACESGPAVPCTGRCHHWDFDNDGDVDQSDFSMFQRCFSGATVRGDPNCVD